MSRATLAIFTALMLAAFGGLSCSRAQEASKAGSVDPSTLPRTGTVDERFQSYNVEMIEVTGGRFWKPYKDLGEALKAPPKSAGGTTPSGMDAAFYEQRPPVDLDNARLRKLAAALGPAYMRVSGTWANTTYFHDAPTPPPARPPAGFGGAPLAQRVEGRSRFLESRRCKTRLFLRHGTGHTRRAGQLDAEKKRRKFFPTRRARGAASLPLNS